MPEERKFMLYSVLGVLLIMVSVFCVTYAWLNTKSSLSNNDTVVVKTADLSVSYEKSTTLTVGNIKPGDTVEKTFKIKNNSTGAVNYNIIWSYVENDFQHNKDLVYIISGNGKVSGEKVCPSNGSNIPILKNVTIEKDSTHIYSIVARHKNEGKRKNTNLFKGKLEVTVNSDEISTVE